LLKVSLIHPEGKEKTVDSRASKKINFEYIFLLSLVESRWMEERRADATASYVVSINSSIKNHWYEPVRDINDCLFVLRSAAAHFATR
jgi:hypothetical protein